MAASKPDLFMRLVVVWLVGVVAYLLVAAVTVYSGGIEWIMFQPIIGSVISAVFVLLGLGFGSPFRHPAMRPVWHEGNGGRTVACGLATLGIAFLVYGFSGDRLIRRVEDGEVFFESTSWLGPAGYFLLLFSLVNWPARDADLPAVEQERDIGR